MRISDWSSDVCSSDLLEWIKAGCPAGVYDGEDYSHRISARALKSRGLVEIRGHGKTWIATLTLRGENWPEATAYDEGARHQRRSPGRVKDSAANDLPGASDSTSDDAHVRAGAPTALTAHKPKHNTTRRAE